MSIVGTVCVNPSNKLKRSTYSTITTNLERILYWNLLRLLVSRISSKYWGLLLPLCTYSLQMQFIINKVLINHVYFTLQKTTSSCSKCCDLLNTLSCMSYIAFCVILLVFEKGGSVVTTSLWLLFRLSEIIDEENCVGAFNYDSGS